MLKWAMGTGIERGVRTTLDENSFTDSRHTKYGKRYFDIRRNKDVTDE